jgi:hypothetical protein
MLTISRIIDIIEQRDIGEAITGQYRVERVRHSIGDSENR